MTPLWFITPCFKRYDLTAICLEQRQRVIADLAGSGIEAQCVVVADDANLDTARSLGFAIVERDNLWLGRRFNDGIEYAAQHGAEYIVPIGSDSWVDPAYLAGRLNPAVTRTSDFYTVVEGNRLCQASVRDGKGAGPYVFHRSLLEPHFRPARDYIRRGVDGSTIRGLRTEPTWRYRNLHPLQYVGFRSQPQITPYERIRDRWGVAEFEDPWPMLAEHYPADLVERVRVLLTERVGVAA